MIFDFEKSLEGLIRRLLRPLISLFIKNNLQYRRLCQLAKEVYIEVAASEYGKGGRPTNITRIALLTGIDRKEVKRVRDEVLEANLDTPRTQSGSLARVLSAWHQDQRFSTDGTPNPLEIEGSFSELCKNYGGDITRTAILNELLRVSAVRTLPDGTIIAVSRYYMPEKANQEAIIRSLDVFYDVGSTLNHNLYRENSESSRFEGRATNTSIAKSEAKEFKHFVEKKGQEFLEVIDQRLSEHEQRTSSDQEQVRLGIGLYLIENELENPSEN